MGVPQAYWGGVAFVFGAVIGSFLNVVIWRLPRGGSVVRPSGSYCPHCRRPLKAYENIPLLSFLALQARCRTCHGPISWRYFWVELITALLFMALTLHLGRGPFGAANAVAWCLFAAALVAAFFIDWEHFIIPDEVNTFALLVGVSRDVYGAAVGEPGRALLGGWLPQSIAAGALCAAVFVAIQLFGLALFRKDSMGDGDVKLARAIGAMLLLRLALTSFALAIAAGAVLGALKLAWDARHARPEEDAGTEAEGAETADHAPAREVLFFGTLYVLYLDLLLPAAQRLRLPGADALVRRLEGQLSEELADDDFVAGPSHMPFGPYMAVGALLAVFLGDPLIAWYLRFSGLA